MYLSVQHTEPGKDEDEDKSFSLILLKKKKKKKKKKRRNITENKTKNSLYLWLCTNCSHHNFPETARPQYPHSLSDVEKMEDIFNRRPFPLEYSQNQFRSQDTDLRKIFTLAVHCFFLLLFSFLSSLQKFSSTWELWKLRWTSWAPNTPYGFCGCKTMLNWTC